jgi:hypothetical protein
MRLNILSNHHQGDRQMMYSHPIFQSHMVFKAMKIPCKCCMKRSICKVTNLGNACIIAETAVKKFLILFFVESFDLAFHLP